MKILVFGATGQTGRRFTELALQSGHRVSAVVRDPFKLAINDQRLSIRQGDIASPLNFDEILHGVDSVVIMLGNAAAQQRANINAAFVRNLVPAMRRNGVRRLLYQAGGLSQRPGRPSLLLALLKSTIARSFRGQHRDNAATMAYLSSEAMDIDWVVHRAGIDPSATGSKGTLERSKRPPSLASFEDCAAYNLHAIVDPAAIHTMDGSRYRRRKSGA